MILKYLNESLLKEDIEADGVELITGATELNPNKLYLITSLNGFNAWNDSMAEEYGFTEQTWNQYMTGDNAQKAILITDASDEPVGMFLTTRSNSELTFPNGFTYKCKLSFEAQDHSSDFTSQQICPSYFNLIEYFPSYTFGDRGEVYDEEDRLVYVDQNFANPDVAFDSVIKVKDGCTGISDTAFTNNLIIDFDEVSIPESVGNNMEAGTITRCFGTDDVIIRYRGLDNLPEWVSELQDAGYEVQIGEGFSQEEIEAHQQEVERIRREREEAAAEEERQRIAAENQAAAQEVIDAIQTVSEVTYNRQTERILTNIQILIQDLTDEQKALVTNLGDYENMVTRFNELKDQANNVRAELRANSNKVVVGQLVFELKNNEAHLIYVKPNRSESNVRLTIPPTVNNHKVTRIEADTFEDHAEFNHGSIDIPDTVRYIGPNAFRNCNAQINILGDRNKIKFGRNWR